MSGEDVSVTVSVSGRRDTEQSPNVSRAQVEEREKRKSHKRLSLLSDSGGSTGSRVETDEEASVYDVSTDSDMSDSSEEEFSEEVIADSAEAESIFHLDEEAEGETERERSDGGGSEATARADNVAEDRLQETTEAAGDRDSHGVDADSDLETYSIPSAPGVLNGESIEDAKARARQDADAAILKADLEVKMAIAAAASVSQTLEAVGKTNGDAEEEIERKEENADSQDASGELCVEEACSREGDKSGDAELVQESEVSEAEGEADVSREEAAESLEASSTSQPDLSEEDARQALALAKASLQQEKGEAEGVEEVEAEAEWSESDEVETTDEEENVEEEEGTVEEEDTAEEEDGEEDGEEGKKGDERKEEEETEEEVKDRIELRQEVVRKSRSTDRRKKSKRADAIQRYSPDDHCQRVRKKSSSSRLSERNAEHYKLRDLSSGKPRSMSRSSVMAKTSSNSGLPSVSSLGDVQMRSDKRGRKRRKRVTSSIGQEQSYADEFSTLLQDTSEFASFQDFLGSKPRKQSLLELWSEGERYKVLLECTDPVAAANMAIKLCKSFAATSSMDSHIRMKLVSAVASNDGNVAANTLMECKKEAFEKLLDSSYPDYRLRMQKTRKLDRRASISVGANLIDPFEEEETADNVRYDTKPGSEEQILVAATVPKLIQKLTADVNDPDFTFIFLLTHNYVLRSSKELIRLLAKRYRFVTLQAGADCTSTKTRIMLRTVNVIKLLIDIHRETLKRDSSLVEAIKEFADSDVQVTLPPAAKNLKDYLKKRLENGDDDEEAEVELQFSTKAPKPKKLRSLSKSSSKLAHLSLDQVKPLELARQMAIHDHRLYRSIRPTEMLHQHWTKRDTKERDASNVLAMIKHFNSVGHWTITEIITKVDLEKRVKVLQRLIAVADECLKLQNLNGAMAILSGLKNSNVSRLKKTWAAMSSSSWDTWEHLESVLRVDENFKALRGYMGSLTSPTIPYLGMYLGDLTFLDGDSTYLERGRTLVNFSKLRNIATVVRAMAKDQATPFNLEPLPQVQDFLLRLPVLPEKDFYEQSQFCEARKKRSGAAPMSPPPLKFAVGSPPTEMELERKADASRTLKRRGSSPSLQRRIQGKTDLQRSTSKSDVGGLDSPRMKKNLKSLFRVSRRSSSGDNVSRQNS